MDHIFVCCKIHQMQSAECELIPSWVNYVTSLNKNVSRRLGRSFSISSSYIALWKHRISSNCARFWSVTAVLPKIQVFWDVTLWGLLNSSRRFERNVAPSYSWSSSFAWPLSWRHNIPDGLPVSETALLCLRVSQASPACPSANSSDDECATLVEWYWRGWRTKYWLLNFFRCIRPATNRLSLSEIRVTTQEYRAEKHKLIRRFPDFARSSC